MNNSLDLEETKIFNDYHNFAVGKKKSALVKVYKYTLLGIFLLFSLLLLVFIERTFFGFGNLMFQNWKISDFLNFDTLKNKQRNFMILIRFALLSFVLFYSIIKNYTNVYFQKETIKKYWPWFTSYLVLTVISFVLLFGYFPNTPAKLSYSFLLLIPLFILNLVYAIYLYKLKKKTDPNSYNNRTSIMIGLISQGLIVLITIIAMSAWVLSAKSNVNVEESLFNNNGFNDFWNKLFTVKTTTNLVLILLFTTISMTILIGAFSDKIAFLFFKQNKKEYYRDRIIISLTSFAFILVWTLRSLFYKIDSKSIFGNSLENYAYLTEILIGAIIFSLFVVSQFTKKIKTASPILNLVNHVFAQTLLWTTLFTMTLLNKQNTMVNMINVFFVGIFSFAMLVIYFIKNTNYNLVITFFIRFAILGSILALITFCVNQILISNKNYIFLTIDSNLYLTQIMLVLSTAIWATFLLYSIVSLIVVANKITYFNKKKLGGVNEYEQQQK